MTVGTASPRQYRVADLTIDTATHDVFRGDITIPLPQLSYRLLLALIEHAPALRTHDNLTEEVWQGRYVSPETVTQRVKLLRQAIGDDAREPRYIGLVRGEGYRLLPEVVEIGGGPSEPASRAMGAPAIPGTMARRAKPMALAVSLALAAGVLLLSGLMRPATAEREVLNDPVPRGLAQAHYDTGQYLMNRRLEGDLELARDYFLKAVDEDAGFADAWVELAGVYYILSRLGQGGEAAHNRTSMQDALLQALQIEPQSAELHARMSRISCADGDYESSRRHLERALELDPGSPRVIALHADMLMWMGQKHEAADRMVEVVRLTPLSVMAHLQAITALLATGRTGEAEQLALELASLELSELEAGRSLAMVALLRRQPQRALAALGPDHADVLDIGMAAIAYHLIGDEPAFEAAVERLSEDETPEAIVRLAEISAVVGDGMATDVLSALRQRAEERPDQWEDIRQLSTELLYSPFLSVSLSGPELVAALAPSPGVVLPVKLASAAPDDSQAGRGSLAGWR